MSGMSRPEEIISHGLARGDGPLLEALRQRRAAQELEDEVGPVLAASDVEERRDVRVRKVRGRLRLAEEPLLARLRSGPRRDGLERDGTAELAVARLVHDAEPAAAELPNQLEAPHERPGAQGAIPGRLRLVAAHVLLEQRRERPRADTLRLRRGPLPLFLRRGHYSERTAVGRRT